MEKHFFVSQFLIRVDKLTQLILLGLFLQNSPLIFAAAQRANVVQTAQQSKTIVGTIVDSEGEVIIGANVRADGTSTGTITDLNGHFSLSVPSGKKVIVSYIGYVSQTLLPEQGKELKIVLLEDSKKLDEVVCIGYGSQKLKNITGSVVTIKPSDFEDLATSGNLTEALAGLVPGLHISSTSGSRPSDAPDMSIRQSFTLSKDGGSSTPLIVIDDVPQVDPSDGLPTAGAFNSLDPSEIESITILRDASAAIYGSRASQGAVIVKTKRGKSGIPRISYRGNFELKDAVSHQKTMNAYQYGQFVNSFLRAGGTTSPKSLYSDEELEKMKSLDYDWLDNAWHSAFTQKHSLNASGGTEKGTYYAGLTYYDQGANIGSVTDSRWSFRSSADVKFTSYLKMSASLSATQSTKKDCFSKAVSVNDGGYGSKSGGSYTADYGYLSHIPKYIPWSTNIDGEEYFVSPALGPNKVSSNATSNIGGWNYFALNDNGSSVTNKSFSYTGNFALTYDVPFVKGLSIRGNYSRSSSSSNNVQLAAPYTLALASNTNSEGHHLYDEATKWKIQTNSTRSRVVYGNGTSTSSQANLSMVYNVSFGSHMIDAMLSMERSEAEAESRALQYDNPENPYLGTSATAGTLNADNSETTRDESGTLSYLGRLNYSYANRYLFQFLFRSDASTKFAPEKYWGFFPSVSCGWIMSEEKWFKDKIKWVDHLKIRYSIGKTGKDNIKAWKWLQTYTYANMDGLQYGSSTGGTYGKSLVCGVSPNRKAAWDTTLKMNLGVDVNFLGDRLNCSMDYYIDKTKDMLTNMSSAAGVPISVGGSFAEENYSSVKAWGGELSLNWSDKIGNIHYSIGVSTGWSGNKVLKYPDSGQYEPYYNSIREGYSRIYPFWGYKAWQGTSSGDGILRTDDDVTNYWSYLTDLATKAGTTPSFLGITDVAKMKKGMLVYQDENGSWNNKSRTYAMPNGQIIKGEDYAKLVKKDQSHSFNTSLGVSWGAFSFKTNIAISWGGVCLLDVVKQGTSSNQIMWNREVFWKDMYDADLNPNGKYPNMAYYSYFSDPTDFWMLNPLRIQVRNMTLSYALPKSSFKLLGISSARFVFTGQNLFDLVNPYPNHYRNMYDSSYVNFPTLRTWTLGVDLSF